MGGSLTGSVAALLQVLCCASHSGVAAFCAGKGPSPAQALGPGVAAMGLTFYTGGQLCISSCDSQSSTCLGWIVLLRPLALP